MTDIMQDLAARERALPTKPTRDAYARGEGPAVDYEDSEGLEFMEHDDRTPAREFALGFATACAFWVGIAGVALAMGVRPW